MRPLEGLRVLDRTLDVGELCGRLLGDLGADVVRVGPFSDDLSWRYRNWNKRGVVDDAAVVAGADVVLHSSLEVVAPAHPRQVVCAITWFGQTGPYANWPGNDDVAVGMSGWLSQSGVPEKPPLLMPGQVASDAASVMGAWAVLAGLRTGRAQTLDVSAFEAVTQIDTWSVVNASNGAGRRVRGGPQMYPAIPTKDGVVKVVVMSLKQWRALFAWLGEPEALADPAFDQMLTRIMRRDEINAVLTPFLATMTAREASEEAQRRGIVITPINGPAELLADEHLAARDAFVQLDGGRVPAGFWELDGERLGYRFPAPATPEEIDWAPRTAAAAPAEGAPLAGVRVLDFGQGGVGVQCGRMFADHGAEVIKIESRGHFDFMRLMGADETSPSFASSSRSKLGFGVNLKAPEGVELVKRLVSGADVVIENSSTGTMEAFGLGWDELRASNAGLVMLSSQLLGSHGPRAAWSGYGPSVQAYGGLLALWAFDDRDGWPGSPSNHPDLLVGHLLAVLGLAMLHGGVAGHGELAQAEAVLCTLGDLVWQEDLSPGSVRPQGNRSQVVRCDGDEEWIVASTDDDLSWCASTPADAAAARLRDKGVPAARMAYPPDLLTDPQLIARGFLDPLTQPEIGPLVLDRQSYLASDMPLAPQRPAPRLGEHTRAICHTHLGLDDSEIDRLIASGVLETP